MVHRYNLMIDNSTEMYCIVDDTSNKATDFRFEANTFWSRAPSFYNSYNFKSLTRVSSAATLEELKLKVPYLFL